MNPLIQRFPAGLLPALGIKASETPTSLMEEVQPGVDMLPFYLADRLETISATTVGVTSVTTVSVQVPSGEYWWLWAINAIAATISAPGANMQLNCGVQTPDGSGPTLAAMLAPVVSIAGQQFHLSAVPPQGLLLRPGCFVFAGTEVDPGAQTFDLTVRALFARLTPNS